MKINRNSFNLNKKPYNMLDGKTINLDPFENRIIVRKFIIYDGRPY